VTAPVWSVKGWEAVRALRANMRVFLAGLQLIWRAAPLAGSLFLLLLVVQSAAPVVQVWLVKAVTNALASGHGAGAMVPAFGYALTLLVPGAIRPAQLAIEAWMEDRAVAAIDRRLMDAGSRLVDLVRLERPAFQDEVRFTQESALRVPRILTMLQYGPGTMLTLAGLFVLLSNLNPLLPLALAVFTVPHLIAEAKHVRLRSEAIARRARPAREMDYCVRITTEPSAAKEVRVFGLGRFFLERFRARFKVALRELNRARLGQMKVSALYSGVHALALGGGFWYVASQVGAGRLTVGDVALYVNALVQAESTMGLLEASFGQLYETTLCARRMFALWEGAGPSISVPPADGAAAAPGAMRRGIELRHVRFHYPEGSRDVLSDVSVALPAGRVTALVGANGAGKSTLVKLLTRMYDPTDGLILLDGVPYPEYGLEDLRRMVAVVYQDFAHFALTLGENIAVGGASGTSRAGAEVAGDWAGVNEIAGRLPQGYDTELMRTFEGGVELSGGEWQKVALARGYIRDAALIILDEPTAALNADAEYRLFECFRELMRGRTALIISHRFSTVRMADQIVVLEDGRVLESGSHEELIARGGRYAQLFDMQAGRYR
jgi:ATP-binding cassette, subfamily B, bacterial